ncbi:MAG TPA: hypothetical protein ENJ93_02105 [Chloroflexi bacterium]|nr:hypothetical protein [Chloroflexota bacterium]
MQTNSVKSESYSGENNKLLRYTLRSNAAFSAVSGVIAILAAAPIAAFMGLASPLILVVIGVGLLPFAFLVYKVSTMTAIKPLFVKEILVMDLLWIGGSVAILLVGWPVLTTNGRWLVAILADIVAVFALLEFVGLHRLPKD